MLVITRVYPPPQNWRLLHLLHFGATAIRQPHGWLPGIKDRIDLAQERLPQNPRKASGATAGHTGHSQIINQQSPPLKPTWFDMA